ncbi:unnamed protein product [Porites evermanni]|uniref:Flagellar FliJ protein n=1 Tax=Porites evermanni TaxID=104178 RepID=A0ABN8QNT4_9CNID|nr:unnamed protein product [Porites evermanni]
MEAKIRKELEGIEEVKNELRRTLSQGLGDLENVYFEENAYHETLYNHDQPEVEMHFKSILDAEMSLDKGELLKSLKQEKNKMRSHYANKHKLVEHHFALEIVDMEQRFKQQKNDLMNILEGKSRTWKRALLKKRKTSDVNSRWNFAEYFSNRG